MKTNSFSNKDYLEYDKAKFIIIDYLKRKGWIATINPDRYGVDILADHSEKGKLTIDVEVKNWNWTNREDFPFSDIHFTSRKKKIELKRRSREMELMEKKSFTDCIKVKSCIQIFREGK